MDLEKDHATVVPLWQQGFSELAPYVHQSIKTDGLFQGGLALCFGLSALFRGSLPGKIGMSLFGGLALLIQTPVGGWLLSKALWKGIQAETKRDMTKEKIQERYLKDPCTGTFLVAEYGGKVVGCIAAVKQHCLAKEARVKKEAGGVEAQGEASVWRLSVDPATRKLGVGRALMAAAEDWAVKNGCSYLSLLTANRQSQKFYWRLGYKTETLERALKIVFNSPDPSRYSKPTTLGERFKAYLLGRRISASRGTILSKELKKRSL